ncbi:TIGR03560 family F420-dependent LLM class oxidoreductase [Sciscionella sediminilitoris]|uniref:TIGR03560 family F420-dependent LLM class oxidoreductase n=1 Tax=Sciscionella sediminilitoris TaxID=1445613 RepID=UPI0004DFB819|nr:TIGR03560 family F420-dependent LLM class oxidoreductase [Sciscionella sp. SE31]
MTKRFGIFAPQGWRLDLTEIADPVEQYEAMTAVAQAADRGPWDSVWLFDHMHTVPEVTRESTFEAWISTAGLLRDTRRVRVGQMVTCNGYRSPALLAKMASTAHVAGGGRLYTGLGAGWYEQEWTAYGYPWRETRERMAAFGESVELVHRLFREDKVAFHGAHYQVENPVNEPKSAGGNPVPLWIGGAGEQVTLRLVARYADACNLGRGKPEVIRQKLDVLRRHCDRIGRDFGTITKSTSISAFPIAEGADPERATGKARGRWDVEGFHTNAIAGSPPDTPFLIGSSAAITEWIGTLFEAGIDYVVVYIPGVAYDHEPLHRFAEEIIPQAW